MHLQGFSQVTLAARLEALCKPFGLGILIANQTRHRLPRGRFQTRTVDRLPPSGNLPATDIHELVSENVAQTSTPPSPSSTSNSHRVFRFRSLTGLSKRIRMDADIAPDSKDVLSSHGLAQTQSEPAHCLSAAGLAEANLAQPPPSPSPSSPSHRALRLRSLAGFSKRNRIDAEMAPESGSKDILSSHALAQTPSEYAHCLSAAGLAEAFCCEFEKIVEAFRSRRCVPCPSFSLCLSGNNLENVAPRAGLAVKGKRMGD